MTSKWFLRKFITISGFGAVGIPIPVFCSGVDIIKEFAKTKAWIWVLFGKFSAAPEGMIYIKQKRVVGLGEETDTD